MPRTDPSPRPLARQSAGRYVSPDGRFSVDQASGGWMLTDQEQRDDLGLPLVRGPFSTLDGARSAMEAARVEPAPASELGGRLAAARSAGQRARPDTANARSAGARPPHPIPPPRPPVTIRPWRRADGAALRDLWAEAGLGSLGDDDESLAAMARRNPGLLLVAVAGDEIVGSALGGWDGRRGWIYHLATARPHRRRGIARRLVAELETRFRALGCPKVNVIVLDGNVEATEFWTALGYVMLGARQYGRLL